MRALFSFAILILFMIVCMIAGGASVGLLVDDDNPLANLILQREEPRPATVFTRDIDPGTLAFMPIERK